MAKVYLAARYSRRLELQAKIPEIEFAGHTVVSRWVSGSNDGRSESFSAVQDENDIRSADVLILFTEQVGSGDRGSGGRHVEFGIAHALGKQTIVIGHRENVFHSLPGVVIAKDWKAAISAIDADDP